MIEKTVYGNMQWWDVAEQPSLSDLPPEFKKSYDLYYENAEKNFTKIVNLLQPFLWGIFMAENIGDPDDLFAFEDSEVEEDRMAERKSYLVKLVGVDFKTDSPLPLVKTEALFKVPFVDNVDDIDEERVTERFLEDVFISFGWDLPDVDDNLDLSWQDHQGREAIIYEGDTLD